MFRERPEIPVTCEKRHPMIDTRLRDHGIDQLGAAPPPKQLGAQPSSALPETVRDAEQRQLTKVHSVLDVKLWIAEQLGQHKRGQAYGLILEGANQDLNIPAFIARIKGNPTVGVCGNQLSRASIRPRRSRSVLSLDAAEFAHKLPKQRLLPSLCGSWV